MLNQYPMWKNLLVAVVLLTGLLYALPNIYSQDPVIEVTGTRIENLAATVDMEADEAVAFFHEQLDEQGVLKVLRRTGVEEGDTVVIGPVEFVYTTEKPRR